LSPPVQFALSVVAEPFGEFGGEIDLHRQVSMGHRNCTQPVHACRNYRPSNCLGN
jgi:hypothetical protein